MTVDDEFKHKGNINALIHEYIDGCSFIFSGAVDSSIKLWNIDIDYNKSKNYVKTLYGHKGSVLSLVYSKVKNMLFSCSTDRTIRIWRYDDNFDKILNPVLNCILVIRVNIELNKDFEKKGQIDSTFWVNVLSVKESDKVELFAGDTEGKIHVYEDYDANSLSTYSLKKKTLSVINTNLDKTVKYFNYVTSLNQHKLTVINIFHSHYDSMVYSIGFDSLLSGYSLSEKKSI